MCGVPSPLVRALGGTNPHAVLTPLRQALYAVIGLPHDHFVAETWPVWAAGEPQSKQGLDRVGGNGSNSSLHLHPDGTTDVEAVDAQLLKFRELFYGITPEPCIPSQQQQQPTTHAAAIPAAPSPNDAGRVKWVEQVSIQCSSCPCLMTSVSHVRGTIQVVSSICCCCCCCHVEPLFVPQVPFPK
jgi:hypothetical protein